MDGSGMGCVADAKCNAREANTAEEAEELGILEFTREPKPRLLA